MSFTPSFAVSQVSPLPGTITLTDNSTGTDGAITSRRIYLIKSDGSYLVPTGTTTDYILWPLSGATATSISLNVLERDLALNIRVEWNSVSGSALYDISSYYAFTLYSELFYYSLTQLLAANYISVKNKDYYYNKMVLRVNIDESNNAIKYGSDIKTAQDALDRAYYFVQNKNIFF